MARRPPPTPTSAPTRRAVRGSIARVVGDVLALAGNHAAGVDAIRIYPAYLAAVEQLWHFIDGWQITARE